MANKTYDKIAEIFKNDETVYEFGVYEDDEYIGVHALFEADEEECVGLLKKVCLKVCAEIDEIRGFEINTMFCEALFYI